MCSWHTMATNETAVNDLCLTRGEATARLISGTQCSRASSAGGSNLERCHCRNKWQCRLLMPVHMHRAATCDVLQHCRKRRVQLDAFVQLKGIAG